ncbi:MAG: F0F1 ATP synthase subunit I [Gammaproteobacteria bacterium]|nr:MAG: F0F1 ATP synthase subunit I [Gammaproteobacteria bacterium]
MLAPEAAAVAAQEAGEQKRVTRQQAVTLKGINKPPVYRVNVLQLSIALILAAIALGWGRETSLSVLAGGLICAVPNLYFTSRVFTWQGARAARQIVKSFYRAEAVKLILTAILFAFAFRFAPWLEVLPLFIGFIVVQAVHWLAPWIIRPHNAH